MSRIAPYSIATFLVLVFISIVLAQEAEKPDPQLAQIEKLEELFRMYSSAGRFRGAALVALDDKILLSRGYGLANERWQIPNTDTTRFATASLSKQFTAAAAMVLVERGKLDLDKPIAAYLPDLRKDVASLVTLRDLLTHTSGVKREVFEDFEDTLRSHRSSQILAAINSSGLEFDPGERHAYTNTGYVLVRLVIEATTSKDFPTAMGELIFGPAGMTDSGYRDPAKVIPQLATGYDIILGEAVPAEWSHPSNHMGAGGLYTTVRDLEAYDRALRNGRVLGKPMQAERLASRRFGWGLGWQLLPSGEDDEGEPIFAIYHNGDDSGVASHYLRFPGDGLVIALLSNQSDLPRTELFQKIIGILNDGEPSPPRPRLAGEIYETVVEQGEQAGLELAKQARKAGRRGVPIAMQAIQIGNALSRMGRDEGARRIYAFAALSDPKAPWGHLGLGQWYEDQGQPEAAARHYRSILEQDPEQPHARAYLAKLTTDHECTCP